jgi:TP901 family phage tail tape measure protein
MADLLARFKLVDEMSDKLGRMAESGQDMAAQFEQAGAAANAAFDNISGGVSSAVSSVDGVATSIDSLQSSVDNWTSAVGNYDRSALEAIYSTEELVEMGLKSADALEEQQRMFELCEQSAQALGKSMDATADIQEGLSNAIEQSDKAIKSVTNNEKVSAEVKANLAEAAEKAAEAMNELEQAQQEADAAMEAYDRTMASGTTDLNQLEAAAERAGHAAEALAEANGKASDATEELSKATEQANEEAEQGGKSGKEAIEGIASALAAAGITATLKEISGAVYELADSFSEAEKIIVGATGATGQELDNLMASATNVFANSNAESLNEVAAGMTSVQRATGLTGEALEEATNAGLVLNNVLGYEVSESSRTASALMKNFGLSAEEAYNLIVIGAQQGADRNGDLLDVLNEYAPQYAALGLSAQEFLSSLVDGADAGVFSMDKVGDAVKEFNIRAKDGSDSTAEAFENLGMNADVMTARFAAGGEQASTAFFEVVNALNSMSDPVEKNTTAVALFGTQYEDLEASILPVLANIQGGTLDMYDALGKVSTEAKSMGDNWQQAGNSISAAFGTAVTPTLEKASNALAGFVQGIGEFLQEHPTLTKAITAIGIGLGVVVAGIAGVTFVTTVAIPAVTAFGAALNTALGPIGWVALAITGIVAAGTAHVGRRGRNRRHDGHHPTAVLRAARPQRRIRRGLREVRGDLGGSSAAEISGRRPFSSF